MGPENRIDLTGCRLYLNGEPVTMGQLPEITLATDAPEPAGMISKMEQITMTFKTPKRWRCRSRKRFIKLVMSEGVSRNYAEWLAYFTRKWLQVSYGEAWRNNLWRGWTFCDSRFN